MTERGGQLAIPLEVLFPELFKRNLAMQLINKSKKIDGITEVVGITDVGIGVCNMLVFLAEGNDYVPDATLDVWLKAYNRVCTTTFQRELLKNPQILTEDQWDSLETVLDQDGELEGRQVVSIWKRQETPAAA